MTLGLQTAAYLSAAVLFILALGGLSNQEKAKRSRRAVARVRRVQRWAWEKGRVGVWDVPDLG